MYWDLEIRPLAYSWKSEGHIKFSQQWSTLRIRWALPGSLDQTPTLPPIPDNERTQDTVFLCDLLTGDIAYNIFPYSALKYSRTSVSWYASAGPLKRVGGLFYRWLGVGAGLTTFQFFFSGLDCGENIVKFVFLSHVLPMHLRRSCSLYQSGKFVIVYCTGLFSDSSASIIVWAIVKDIIVTGSWDLRRRLEAWLYISLLRADSINIRLLYGCQTATIVRHKIKKNKHMEKMSKSSHVIYNDVIIMVSKRYDATVYVWSS